MPTPIEPCSKTLFEELPPAQPKPLSEVELSHAVEGLLQQGSPFEALVRDIFKKVATLDQEAIQLRALSLEKEQAWRKELLQKLAEEGVSSATKNRQNSFVSKIVHAVESVPLLAAGITAICASTGMGIVALGIAGTAVGGLMILDSVLDDPAKKALADALGKGNTESTQTWLGRISLATGIASLACSIGLTWGSAGLLSKGAQFAITAAQSGSQAFAQGTGAFTQWRANTQNALMLELEDELRRSGKKVKDEFATVKQLEKNIKDLFDMFEASMKIHANTCSRIFDN